MKLMFLIMFKNEQLDLKEHTILLYLLDAVRVSPVTLPNFVKIVTQNERSQKFLDVIKRLQDADDTLAEVQKIRNELR